MSAPWTSRFPASGSPTGSFASHCSSRYPYDLPTRLNALALAGISFGIGLVALMAGQGLAALGTSMPEPGGELSRSRSDDEKPREAGSALPR